MASVTVANISFPFADEDRQVKFLPLDALSLVGALEAQDVAVDFLDYQQKQIDYADPMDPDYAAAFFADAAETVFITTPHDAMPVAIIWAERLKELDPHRQIILAGYGPQKVARPLMAEFTCLDAVIYGTLEIVGPDLVKHRRADWGEVPGIVFRDQHRLQVTVPTAPPATLDRLPRPAYHRVELGSYWEIMIFSACGCPFDCSFCVRSGKLVEKSLDALLLELNALRHTFGQKNIFFYDQTFTLKKQRVLELCRRLKAEGLHDLEWSCTGRLNLSDVELMGLMADAGCKMIYFGVESGSDRVLEGINKKITRALAEKVMHEAQGFFEVSAFFIWGFPFETMADFQQTVEMITVLAAREMYPIVYVLSPLPSSSLYHQYRQQLRFSRDVWEANWPAHLSNPQSRAKVADLIAAHPGIFPGFFTCDENIERKLKIVQDLKLQSHFPDV